MDNSDVLKVMVVDDSPIIVKKLTVLLETLGYKVIQTAENGKDAVEIYKRLQLIDFKPDVITMDITMPEMDGIEATRTIMNEFPDTKIVMVTSHG